MGYLEDGRVNGKFICSKTKKNIFLIGDSIRQGYCEAVKHNLEDVANVFYISDNCRNTQYVITSLNGWGNLFDSPESVDLVQFNCGHWDIAHWLGSELSLTSEEEYSRNIAMVISLIKKIFIRAKVVFITTTPMNPDGTIGVNPRTNYEISRYNFIAKKIAMNAGILINDIHEYVRDWDSICYKDYCHFTDVSYEILGKEIAHRLREVLFDGM